MENVIWLTLVLGFEKANKEKVPCAPTNMKQERDGWKYWVVLCKL